MSKLRARTIDCIKHGRMLNNGGYCAMCVFERERKLDQFTHLCECPRCVIPDNHTWSGISFLNKYGENEGRMFVVRRCTSCSYEWRQS